MMVGSILLLKSGSFLSCWFAIFEKMLIDYRVQSSDSQYPIPLQDI